MLKRSNYIFPAIAGLLVTIAGFSAAAQECDCQKITGSCVGLIEFVRSFGSEPNFGAELIIHSSEKKCSKVEYYIDQTPYQTILVNRQKEPESIFGTSPIDESKIAFRRCSVCANVDQAKSKPEAALSVGGDWEGTTNGFFGSQQSRFSLSVAGSSISGTWSNNKGLSSPIAGNIANEKIVIALTSLGKTQFDLTWNGNDVMSGKWKEGLFSGTIELHRPQ